MPRKQSTINKDDFPFEVTVEETATTKVETTESKLLTVENKTLRTITLTTVSGSGLYLNGKEKIELPEDQITQEMKLKAKQGKLAIR